MEASSSGDQGKTDILELSATGCLKQVELGYEDAGYSDELLSQAQSRGLNALKEVQSIYERAHSVGSDKNFKEIIKSTCATSVVLCATYLGNYDWSNKSCQEVAKDLLELIVDASNAPSVFRLLCGYSEVEDPPGGALFAEGILKEVFSLLKARMNKENWKREPASRQIFHWFLCEMKHPFVGEHLSSVLPPALLLVDDYQPENKLLGVRCLQHVIKEVDPTELRWYGRSEVVYQALEPLLYQQDAALMRELLPCMLCILAVTEHKSTSMKPNRYDKVFQIFLCNMEGEQKIALRRELAQFLVEFIRVMKINILRHMKRLMRVITSYLEISDGKDEVSRLSTLEALKAVIIETWPRIPAHLVPLTKVLLVLLADVDSMDSFNITDAARQQLRLKAEECLLLLKKYTPETVESVLRRILDTSTLSQSLKESLSRVLENG